MEPHGTAAEDRRRNIPFTHQRAVTALSPIINQRKPIGFRNAFRPCPTVDKVRNFFMSLTPASSSFRLISPGSTFLLAQLAPHFSADPDRLPDCRCRPFLPSNPQASISIVPMQFPLPVLWKALIPPVHCSSSSHEYPGCSYRRISRISSGRPHAPKLRPRRSGGGYCSYSPGENG